MEANMSNQSTIIEPTVVLSDNDKIELYKKNIKKILPFIQSTNKDEKKAAYNFNILFKTAINEGENYVLLLLKDAIEHVIKYLSNEFEELVNNKIDWNTAFIGNYELLNDIVVVITQTILHKQNIREFSEFCLSM